ncbi:DUF4976 domain-containing protein [Puteibacter caeruleilacunae]|nr:DUF4976 domain-containing protein [Puteibacter caeruleilacunae]
MNLKINILTIAGLFLALPLISWGKGDNKRPNIIFMMSDDHAMNAISAYGGRLKKVAPTPHIDRLANEGMKMNNVLCTNAICTPSRAVIMSGQYSHMNGVFTLVDDYNPDADNMAKILQRNGYTTAIVGKWHLHKEPKGFDYYNVLPGQGKYHNPLFKEKGEVWIDSKKGGKRYSGYCTDVTADIALEWLKEKRDKSKPFFLMLHQKAPHGLWEYADRHKDYLKDEFIPEPESLYNDKQHGPLHQAKHGSSISRRNSNSMLKRASSPKWPTGKIDTTGLSNQQKTSLAYQKYLKDYLRCVKAVDENVGRVLDYLDDNDLAENTIVIYTSDQGQFLGEHDYYDKRWMYEESLHMPFLIRYPKGIKAKSTNDDICINADFAPSLLDYAGVATPNWMQGQSFKPVLEGNTPANWRKSMYYRYWMHMSSHLNPAHYGVRTDRYKLIFFHGLPLGKKGAKKQEIKPYWEFYDLKKDQQEMKNQYENPKYADVIADLKEELIRLKKQYKDTDEAYPELVKVKEQYWK